MRCKKHVLTILFAVLVTSGSAFSQTISGTVLDGSTNPIGGAVRIYDGAGDPVENSNIDPSGYFQSQALPDGTYYAVTVFTNDVLDEAWDDIPCENLLCDITASTAIVVDGGDVTDIDFVLAPITVGGRISGLITDGSSNPLADVGLGLKNANGEHLFFTGSTGPDGQYQTSMLADGSYYIHTINEPFGLGRELYDGVPCLPADLCGAPAFVTANGTLVVIDGSDQAGIDFSLEVPGGGQIIGRVSDADVGIPLPDVHLDLLNAAGQYLANTDTDPLGNYYFSGLPDGDYKVLAIWVPEGYTEELYGGDQCPNLQCDLALSGAVINVSAGAVINGRDIALDYTGTRILGTITRSDTGDPVSAQYGFMGVVLFGEAGDYRGTWGTNRAGQFQITLPGAGNYYLASTNDWNVHGLLDEVWDDISCLQNCYPPDNGATAISPAEGTTFVADFELDPGFTIAGAVQADGSPSGALNVNIWGSGGEAVLTAWNDGGGNWVTPPLPPGSYYATVRGEEFGLASQLYDGLACPQEYCDVTTGTPIVLVDSDVSSIDFNLLPFNADWTIAGSVRDGDGNPIGGGVAVFDPFGRPAGFGPIDPSGHFQTGLLADGTYFVVTTGTGDYLDEAWDDMPCENRVCDVTAGTAIVVNGADVGGIDFVLDPLLAGGRISGRVTDDSDNPATGTALVIRNRNGEQLIDVPTDSTGYYESPLLANDSYFVHTTNESFGLGRELYDNVPCVPGDLCYDPAWVAANGTPIVVDGDDRPGIDFRLEVPAGGQIVGQVSDADLGMPLPDVHLDLLNAAGQYLANTNTDAWGNYYFAGLPDGDYKVLAIWVPEGYTEELYGGDQCPGMGCDLGAVGTVISISGGAVASGIDIDLDFSGTRIVGTITRSDTGDPVSGILGHMGVNLFSEAGDYIDTWSTNSAGQYQINAPGAGSYYLRANNDWAYHGLVNEIWDDHKCYDDCDPLNNGGDLVAVAEGATFIADFVLDPALMISGTVRFEGALTPDSYINIWNALGDYVTTAGNDGTGNWRTGPIEAGTYYATARGEEWNMVSQLYDGISCPLENCVYASGTPIVLSDASVSGIDFDLVAFNPQWTISGSVLDSVGQSPGGVVRLFYPNGAFAAEFPIDGAGNFQSYPLLDGSYFMVTFGTSEMLDEAWDDVPCENLSCDITGSTPIVINGANVTGIDFVLEPILDGGRISGLVTDAADTPLPGIGVMIRNRDGEYLFGLAAGPDGRYRSGFLANDSYFVHTTGEPFGLGRELFDDVKCLPADACFDPGFVSGSGTPVLIDSSDATAVDFKLAVPGGGQIQGRVSDADLGVPLPDVHLDLLNADGLYQGNTDSDASGNFYFSGLPDGTYKVLAIVVPAGYTQELYGGDPCPDLGCDLGASGAVITISGGEISGGRDIALDFTGTRIFGTVTRSDTGDPVSARYAHMGVDLFSAAGDHLGTWPTNNAGQYQIVLGGAGDFYLSAINDFAYHRLVNEVWDDIRCYGNCFPPDNGGDLLPVTEGTTVIANFELDPDVILRNGFE